MRYRYYLLLRSAMPGTIPMKNLVGIENFDSIMYNEDAGREVWGYVEYSQPLTDKTVSEYDLMEVQR